MADIIITNHGTLTVLHAMNEAATEWLHKRLDPDVQRFGDGFVVEPRYLEPIIEGAVNSGFEVEAS